MKPRPSPAPLACCVVFLVCAKHAFGAVLRKQDGNRVAVKNIATVQRAARLGLQCKPSSSTLDSSTLTRASANVGENWVWQSTYDRFVEHKPITVLLLGGSVELRPWVISLGSWLEEQLPGSRLVIGAQGSSGSMWLYDHMNQSGRSGISIESLNPQLIIADTSVNPWQEVGGPKGFLDQRKEAFYVEKIVRQALSYQFRPTLVFLEWMSLWDNVGTEPHFHTNEDAHMPVLRYYGIPSCSARDALWPHLDHAVGERHWNRSEILPDGLHPSKQSGEFIVDLLSDFICTSLHRAAGVAQGHRQFWPAQLPPVLMTDGTVERLGRAPREDDMEAIQNVTAVLSGSDDWTRGNATALASDLLTLVSGGSLMTWQVLVHWCGRRPGGVAAVPRATALTGSWFVRVLAHFHIAAMHYYSLLPEHIGAVFGFPSWARFGSCWVPFFFMLSGFVAYLADGRQGDSANIPGLANLLGRRLAKYYPAFALSIVITVGTPVCRVFIADHLGQFFLTLFLVQSWVRPFERVLMNGPSWYLSNLVAFSLAAPFWSKQVRLTSSPVLLLSWLWITSCMFPFTIRALNFQPLLGDGLASFVSFSPWCNWPCFLSGMVLARVFGDFADSWRGLLPFKIGASVAFACLALLFLVLDVDTQAFEQWLRCAWLPPVFACLITALAAGEDKVFQLLGLLPCAEWLAGCAWCLYILHVPLFLAFHPWVSRHLGLDQPEVLALLASVAAAIVHTMYDAPIQARLGALLSRPSAQLPGSPGLSAKLNLCKGKP
mmetsp:Transcript_125124/g.325060  ORF Transcript_125124/g.325060 Transcript_125124/m.325060 type:complete len:772 (+) Transcript_125124:40-2355(+)